MVIHCAHFREKSVPRGLHIGSELFQIVENYKKNASGSYYLFNTIRTMSATEQKQTFLETFPKEGRNGGHLSESEPRNGVKLVKKADVKIFVDGCGQVLAIPKEYMEV